MGSVRLLQGLGEVTEVRVRGEVRGGVSRHI